MGLNGWFSKLMFGIAGIVLVLFVMFTYDKLRSWFGGSDLIYVLLLVLIILFVLAGVISMKKIKKKLGL